MIKKNITTFQWPSRLKTIRVDAELSQAEWAQVLNFSAQQIARFETGRTEPPIQFWHEIHTHYSINLLWILFGFGDKYTKTLSSQASLAYFSTASLRQELERRDKLIQIVTRNINALIQDAGKATAGWNLSAMKEEILKAARSALPPDAPDWLQEDIMHLLSL